MKESTREIARDIVDQLWEDLEGRKGMLDEVDQDVQMEIRMAWYGIAEDILDEYMGQDAPLYFIR